MILVCSRREALDQAVKDMNQLDERVIMWRKTVEPNDEARYPMIDTVSVLDDQIKCTTYIDKWLQWRKTKSHKFQIHGKY